jgi:hypothetical protein
MTEPLRLLVFDRTCHDEASFVGLSSAWAAGALLYRALVPPGGSSTRFRRLVRRIWIRNPIPIPIPIPDPVADADPVRGSGCGARVPQVVGVA